MNQRSAPVLAHLAQFAHCTREHGRDFLRHIVADTRHHTTDVWPREMLGLLVLIDAVACTEQHDGRNRDRRLLRQ